MSTPNFLFPLLHQNIREKTSSRRIKTPQPRTAQPKHPKENPHPKPKTKRTIKQLLEEFPFSQEITRPI